MSSPATLTYLLTPQSIVLLERLTSFQLFKKFPAFYGTQVSLPHSQVPATCPYPEPARSSPHPHIPLPEDPSNQLSCPLSIPQVLPNYQSRSEAKFTFRNKASFYSEQLSAPRPTPKLEDHPLSAVCDCLFNMLAATLHIGGRSSTRNLRTCHAVVTWTRLSRLHQRHTVSKTLPEDGADERRNALEY